MYILECYRKTNDASFWVSCGEFPTVAELLARVASIWALDYRLKVKHTGRIVPILFKDDATEEGYVVPYVEQCELDAITGQKSIPLDANQQF